MATRNIVGPIPDPDELYGRDTLLDHVWQQIEGNNLLLLAPRRFGKSGVMRHILLRPRSGYLPLDFELEDVTSPEEFVWRVTRKLLEQEQLRRLLHGVHRLPSVVTNWVKDTFDGAEFEGAKVAFKKSVKDNWREVGQRMLLEMEKADPTIIFLFDEFPGMIEKLIEHGGEKMAAEFLAWFRTVRLQHKDALRRHRFVVAGSIGIDAILRRLGASGQMNDFKRIYVEPLDEPVALNLANDLANSMDVCWNESLAKELMRLLGANVPYFIHLFFSELGQLPPEVRHKLSPTDLTHVYRERLLGPTCKHYFQHYSERLKRHGKEGEAAAKAILRAVANAPAGRISRSELFDVYQKACGKTVADIEFDELLGDLEHDWYLALDPTTNEYFFKVKLMQDWWSRWYPGEAEARQVDGGPMSIVMHKYTPEQMPEPELVATFAARQHTLEFLLNALRKQTSAGTLSSYLITGPRGAGKSALLRMLRLRIRGDAELSKAWLIVRFPEEQFNVASVRDLLAATLKLLAEEGIPSAGDWQIKVEAESTDEQSEELAASALKEISQRQRQRFILFIENLDEFFDTITDTMKGTLRRLLMSDPFMLIIGSAVHVFESLKKYDEAFFNYFAIVRLDRLNEKEVYELLHKRAEFDHNEQFLREFPRLKPKIRAMTHLSGGNPRLILMLYELLSQKQVTTIVQELRRLVDELTPLLKHELENLPPQQQKIIHALMEKGGTATPAELTTPTRLSLNTVTAQLRRLKEAQILDLRRGGKGRPAYYTVPDQLFCIWYQMRCLNQRRRQIEMFVEVIRIWFEAEERLRTISALVAKAENAQPHIVRETAATTEYFAASLGGTPHAEKAHDLALRQWLKAGDLGEAALAHAEFAGIQATDEGAYETIAYAGLGQWCLNHGDPKTALPALETAAKHSDDPTVLLPYGIALGLTEKYTRSIEVFDRIVASEPSEIYVLAAVLFNRSVSKRLQGDLAGEIADCTAVVELSGAPVRIVASALYNRGVAKQTQGDSVGAIADYTAVVNLSGASVESVVRALLNRGVVKRLQGDSVGAMADYTTVVNLSGATPEDVATALVNRGVAKESRTDSAGAIADYTAAVKLSGAPIRQVAKALINRGVAKQTQGDSVGAIADYTAATEMSEAAVDLVSKALINRGTVRGNAGDHAAALGDFDRALQLPNLPDSEVGLALINRGTAKLKLDDADGALADWLQAMATQGAPTNDKLTAAQAAYEVCLVRQRPEQANMVLNKLSDSLRGLGTLNRTEALVRWLSALAQPELKEGWTTAWRSLAQHQPPEVAEALAVFQPVTEVLEKGDRSVLDPLPPEQREFAEEVLARFEPKRNKVGENKNQS